MAIVGTTTSSVPAAPTAASCIEEGLKRAGRVNPTATEITSATTHQFQEVKSDIRSFAACHPDLISTAVTTLTRGISIYAWPSDARKIRTVTLLGSPVADSWRGTAQTGTATTITFAAAFSQDSTRVVGKWVVTTGGTGVNQYRQINAYNDSTKVATISGDGNWDTTPDSTTTYMIVDYHRQLWSMDKPTEWDRLRAPFVLGTPRRAAIVGLEINLDVAPSIDDDITTPFAILWDYWFDIDQLDESGATFVRMLREWRSLWVQGVAVKTMQRFDDDRYISELNVYQIMLEALAGQSSNVAQVRYSDV